MGWSCSSKKLTSTLKLNNDGLAYVVNDNLGDSCQWMSQPGAGVRGRPPVSALMRVLVRV